ncbi:MAG TPA: hypothetical protein PK573_12030 [Spirochaetota bacterium]|nr:hypothetical protein [Spirochaetota bacterium]HRZ26618.1 hypothetical protein [Spirochaetota bacterium]
MTPAPAFQSHLTLSLPHFAGIIGKSLPDVIRLGEQGELDIQDGMIDLWDRQNWNFFKKAVNLT